jgi:hypothetical protein
MTFKILCINNNDSFKEQLYNDIKTKPLKDVKENLSSFATIMNSSKDELIKDVYTTLDCKYDSITFYIKTTTIFENEEHLIQMMHISDDDIYDAKVYNTDKYKFNYLGKLIINTDDNVNGRFILFAYKINDDNTYDFCDMTLDMYYDLIINNLFHKGIHIDLDEYKQILIDDKFFIYDTEYKSLNININKIENHDFTEENIADFRLGVITPNINEDYYNDILIKLTNNYKYKGDIGYIFCYLNNDNILDNLTIGQFKLLLERDKNKNYGLPNHDKKKFIYNKFTMLKN